MEDNTYDSKDSHPDDTIANRINERKSRINYRKPENAAKLNAAVNALIMQKQDPNGPQDIRTVSKLFNIPYNTLRDNYIRVTTGTTRSSKRVKKRKFEEIPIENQSREDETSDSDDVDRTI